MKQFLLMIALVALVGGFGCSSINQKPGERPEPPTKTEKGIEGILDILGPVLEIWLNSDVSDEQKLRLGDSIKQQIEHGTPEEGWVNCRIDSTPTK